MNDYLNDLNPQQQAAVTYTDGPQLVIAGAGSGKTRVLTYKIVHLLAQDVEPWRILALTFTNKAAKEMRTRIESLVGSETARKLWMGTFHSIFARILRANADRLGFKPNFTIYDSGDSQALIKMIIRDMQLDEKVYKPNSVASAISFAKNALISPDDYANNRDLIEADRQSKRPYICKIYRRYRDRCVLADAMDFDDLLFYTNVLLRDNPDILRHYQEFFKYLLVDEYQDTNFAQHLIVRNLSREDGKVCMVGDDAQSIYSFRGANIRNILELEREYKGLQVFKLEENYRSTQHIINVANSLIEKNKRQIPKNVFSRNSGGSPVEIIESYSDYEEGYLVANKISQLKMRGSNSYDDFAVLYRTNAQSRVLEESLRKRNIPYRIYGGLSFYQRKEVRDAIAYMRLALNPSDDEALKRVINFPARGIGDTTVGKIVSEAMSHSSSMWDVICAPANLPVNAGTMKKLEEFRSLVQGLVDANLTGADADAMTDLIMHRTRMATILTTERTPENISRLENLQELRAGVREFVEGRIESGAGPASLNEFLAEVSLATDQDSDDSSEGDRVTLMTVHAAKGLEFTNVFVVGVEEELFPSSMCEEKPQAIEEERRLLYVAITRAKRFCMLSYATSRFRNGQTVMSRPSRFIMDIDPRLLRPAAGSSLSSRGVDPSANYRSTLSRNSFGRSSNYSRTPARATTQSSPWSHPLTPRPAAPTALRGVNAAESTHMLADVSEGMRVRHIKFGEGTISKIDNSMADARITVDFDNTGIKVLLLKFARFEILDQ